MSFPLFIAKRYIFSKKSTNAINVVSGISAFGIIIATMALVVVLSVFNGFHDMVASKFTNFDPQIKVTPKEGKSAMADDPLLAQLRELDDVEICTEVYEDMALLVFNGHQQMITLKGVDDNFDDLTHIDEILEGKKDFCLHAGELEYGIPGLLLTMNMNLNQPWEEFMKIYTPRREGQLDMSDTEGGFVVDSLFRPQSCFTVGQAKYDKTYLLSSIGFARRMFDGQGMVTALEFRVKSGASIDKVKEKMKDLCGEKFNVLDRYEQQADTYRIMQIEKVLAFVFLIFILIVACFNIIGSISMLVIDKTKDIETLRNLGATDSQIKKIFLLEGRLITTIGALIGVLLGLLLCWLQQQYGFVKLGNGLNYVTSAYPVSVHYLDVAVIFVTVCLIGWIAVWYPVKYMTRQ